MSTSNLKNVEEFCDRLRTTRLNRGWTQEDLAAKLEVSNGSVGNWETGPTIPRPNVLSKIAALLEVDIGWLLHGSAKSRFELKDAPAEKGAGSPYSWMEVKTLENTLVDLSTRLPKAGLHERKHIIGNIVNVAGELEAREISSSASVDEGMGRLLKKVSVDTKSQRDVPK